MAEDPVKKYKDMVQNFKKLCEESLKGQADSWSKLLQSGQQNYNDLQQHYVKGYEDLVQQMMSANKQLLQKLTEQYNELKEKINSSYATLEQQSITHFEQHMSQFRKNCEDVLKKYPGLPPDLHNQVVQDLKQIHGKTQAEIKSQYQVLLRNLDKNYQETVQKLTLSSQAFQAAASSGIKQAMDTLAGSSKK